jgi:transposase
MGAKDQAVGRSRGGLTTKIHVLVDALGRPLSFILTGGQAHDSTTAAALLAGRTTAAVIADKAYDNNALRKLITDTGAVAIVPSLSYRKPLIPHDAVAYQLRNRVERFFNRLKHFRRIATRYDRRAIHFLAALQLASAMIWMR